jgi:hypothetical protein
VAGSEVKEKAPRREAPQTRCISGDGVGRRFMEERWDFSPAGASYYRNRPIDSSEGFELCGVTCGEFGLGKNFSPKTQATVNASWVLTVGGKPPSSASHIHQSLIYSPNARPKSGCAPMAPLAVLPLQDSNSNPLVTNRAFSSF